MVEEFYAYTEALVEPSAVAENTTYTFMQEHPFA